MTVQGIIKIEDYNEVISGSTFREIEKYSDEFIVLQDRLFPEFSKKWVKDSFHQWSRQYEYPFCSESLAKHFSGQGKVLDAGSGITFFPYYLKEKYHEAEIECCDYDPKLEMQFERVNKEKQTGVKYFTADIKNISKPDGCYSAVYCVSVLEHTDDYEAVVKELARITESGGHLILTFDISTDGSADISFGKAEILLETVRKYYDQVPESVSLKKEDIFSPEILTTKYINKTDKKLLPWKYPYLMFFKSLSHGRIPRHLIRNLTCYCGVFRKK